MKPGIIFQQLAKLQKEELSKQPPFTFEEKKASIQRQKERREKPKNNPK